jgi:DNA-binding transcriptional LysR family regulator
VTLTPDGERLLVPAKELIALHDRILDGSGAAQRPIVVDLLSEGRLTGPRILEAARTIAPDREFRGRYGHGVGAAIRQLQTGELDVVLGRAERRAHPLPAAITSRLIRWEPLAVLLPATHPLARLDAVPVQALAGMEIDVNPADPDAPEWSDLVVQFLELSGARATPPHFVAVGLENQADHLVRQGIPILTGIDHVAIPGGVIRPLIDPVAYFPWSIIWRRGLDAAALHAITRAATILASRDGWPKPAPADWLPEPEASAGTR